MKNVIIAFLLSVTGICWAIDVDYGPTQGGNLLSSNCIKTPANGSTFAAGCGGTGVTASTLSVSGNAFSVGGSTFVAVNGHIGIGTNNPAADYFQGISIGLLHLRGGMGSGIKFERTNATARKWEIGLESQGGFNIVDTLEPSLIPRVSISTDGVTHLNALRVGNQLDPTQSTFTVTQGKVGIATMNPGETLTTQGSIGVRSSVGTTRLTLNTDGSQNATIDTTNTPLLVGVGGANVFRLRTNGLATLYANETQNVGIKTESPVTALDVAGNVQIGSGTAKSTYTNSGSAFFPGQVGISTTAPTVKLGVVGDVVVTGSIIASTFNAVGSAFLMNGALLIDSDRTVYASALASTGSMNVSTLSVTGNAFSVGTSTLSVSNGNIGIRTVNPASNLDARGSFQAGSGVKVASITANGYWRPAGQTRAQIDLLVPDNASGDYIYCSDCTIAGLCVSSGTLASQWRKEGTATTGCGTGN